MDQLQRTGCALADGRKNVRPCRVVYKDRVEALMKIFRLPMLPDDSFSRLPHSSDWYDAEESQEILQFQSRTFADCLEDYKKELAAQYSLFFLALIRSIVGPIFGKFIVRRI